MTYEELMAAFQGGAPAMSYGGYMQDGVWVPTATPMPNAYALPGGGLAFGNEQGYLQTQIPGADGGAQAQAYGPGGEIGDSWYNAPSDWRQTALGMAGVAAPFAIPNALSAAGMLGGTGGGAVAGSANQAIDASLGQAYQAAGVGAPAAAGLAGAGGAAGAAGGLGSAAGDAGSLLSGASGLLNSPAAWALGGAALGLAGNGDITSSQNTSGTSSQTGSTSGSSSGSTSTGIAPWMQGYAQQALGNMSALASGPQTNASLDTSRGLLMSLASQGDPTVNSGAAQQRGVIGGQFLNANPYIDSVAGNIGRRMGDAYAIGSRAGQMGGASQSGNWDSAGASQALGLADRNFADALGSTMSNLYYGNYRDERSAQDAAARGSLAFGNFAAGNAMNLANFGNADWQRPFMANQYLANTVNPAWGSQGTSNNTFGQNTSQSGTTNNTVNSTVAGPNAALAGLGGAMAGAGLWRNLFAPRG